MIGVHIKSLIHLYSILKSNDYNVIICFQAGGLVSLLKRISGTNTKIVIRESISPYNLLKLQHPKIRAKLLFFVKKILYSYADMVVANSHAGIEEIKQFVKKPKLKAIMEINFPIISRRAARPIPGYRLPPTTPLIPTTILPTVCPLKPVSKT